MGRGFVDNWGGGGECKRERLQSTFLYNGILPGEFFAELKGRLFSGIQNGIDFTSQGI